MVISRDKSGQPRTGNVRTIAELAGCSPSTVSRVLSGNYGNVRVGKPLRQKIRQICAELGYEPNIHASRMFSKRTGIIGLVIPYGGDGGLHDENLSFFMNEAYETANKADCRLLLLMLNERFKERQDHLSLARRREVDGMIIWGAVGDSEWLDELAAAEMPFVLAVNRAGEHPCIYGDDEGGMAAMVNHCRERGARRFAYVSGAPVDSGQRRRAAFEAALGDCPYQLLEGDFSLATGRQAAGDLLAGSRDDLPDAVVCANDLSAIGFVMGLRQGGLHVPRDIMVTGADNIDLAKYSHPALTTYDQMSIQCGRTCTQDLLRHLEAGDPLETRILPSTIHLREST